MARWGNSLGGLFGGALLVFATGGAALGQDGAEVHTFHCWMSCPVGAPATNDLVVREIYTLSSNDETKFADWVAYRITPQTIGRSQSRGWKADPWLAPEETLEPEDYDEANAVLGTDRGHQAPLAAFSGSAHWRDTNMLSNITPQAGDLNKGPWERIEAKELDWVRRANAPLYVITGPFYERAMPPLPQADEPHQIPSGYWKIIVTEKAEIATFAFDQATPRSAAFCAHQVSLDEIEARTGLRFFPRLPLRQFKPLAPAFGCP